jgi:VanZ family protein
VDDSPPAIDPRPALNITASILLAFGFVGLVFALAYLGRPMMLLLSGFVFALLQALAQVPLPTRLARIEDFLVDAFAARLGITLAYLARSACKSFVA